jgi:hypothetical protein
MEGFWNIFKRGIVGTFHKVSAQYLPLYLAEFQLRYNNRANPRARAPQTQSEFVNCRLIPFLNRRAKNLPS